jgi:hypothetical protein
VILAKSKEISQKGVLFHTTYIFFFSGTKKIKFK